MRRRVHLPTRFSATVDGRDAFIGATPPDETDPATDYYWYARIEDMAEGPVGKGFTDHQAVHDLIERALAVGIAIIGVLKVHE